METPKKATAKKATTKAKSTAAASKPAVKAAAPAKRPAPKKTVPPTGPQLVPAPTHEEISRRAYEIWAGRGYAHGNPAHDWIMAEQELKRA
jgi:hypothetical protein